MARYKVNDEELQQTLKELSGWEVKEGKLHKEYKFGSFAEAIGWMVTVALYADKKDHHPEWFNVYNRVRVDLVTHDMDNAISNLDVDLARRMEELAAGKQ
jgi:4a-hydroxytetrahydrobiopterin dehydratase